MYYNCEKIKVLEPFVAFFVALDNRVFFLCCSIMKDYNNIKGKINGISFLKPRAN